MDNAEKLQTVDENWVDVRLAELEPLIRERIGKGQTVRFYPKGSSMLPLLRPGVDSVILSALPEKLKKYDLVLCRRADGSFFLHRIVNDREPYTCIGDNQLTCETGISWEQLIAVVTAFYRDDRLRSVEDPAYRRYCRELHRRRILRRGKRWLRKLAHRIKRGNGN